MPQMGLPTLKCSRRCWFSMSCHLKPTEQQPRKVPWSSYSCRAACGCTSHVLLDGWLVRAEGCDWSLKTMQCCAEIGSWPCGMSHADYCMSGEAVSKTALPAGRLCSQAPGAGSGRQPSQLRCLP